MPLPAENAHHALTPVCDVPFEAVVTDIRVVLNDRQLGAHSSCHSNTRTVLLSSPHLQTTDQSDGL